MSDLTRLGERFLRASEIEAQTPITAGSALALAANFPHPGPERLALAKLVEFRRRAARMTPEELAERAHLSPSAVHLLEMGVVNPVITQRLPDLAEALHLRAAVLLDLAGVSPDPHGKVRAAARTFAQRVTAPAPPSPEEVEALAEFLRVAEAEAA